MLVTLDWSKVKRCFATVDWGFAAPGVIQIWITDHDGRMYLVHEVYMTKKVITWWVDKAKALKQHYHVEMFVCDPAEPDSIEQFRLAGLPACGADNNITLGIQKMTERLQKAGDGLPRLFILRDALEERDEELEEKKLPMGLAEEIEAYAWPKGQDGKPVKEKPVDKDEHSCDCARYAVMYLDNTHPPASSRAAIPTKAYKPQRQTVFDKYRSGRLRR